MSPIPVQSLQPLYVSDIDRFISATHLNSVPLDTVRSLAMQVDGSPSSIKCSMFSPDTSNWGRPREPFFELECEKRLFSLTLLQNQRIKICSAVRMCSHTSTKSLRALNPSRYVPVYCGVSGGCHASVIPRVYIKMH